MNRVIEIRTYRLKPGRRADFHALVLSPSLPMLQRWQVDVVAFGPSLDGADDYHLLRAYDSVDAMRAQQNEFYASTECREGPRDAVLALIDTHVSTVLALGEDAIDRLRKSGADETTIKAL